MLLISFVNFVLFIFCLSECMIVFSFFLEILLLLFWLKNLNEFVSFCIRLGERFRLNFVVFWFIVNFVLEFIIKFFLFIFIIIVE